MSQSKNPLNEIASEDVFVRDVDPTLGAPFERLKNGVGTSSPRNVTDGSIRYAGKHSNDFGGLRFTEGSTGPKLQEETERAAPPANEPQRTWRTFAPTTDVEYAANQGGGAPAFHALGRDVNRATTFTEILEKRSQKTESPAFLREFDTLPRANPKQLSTSNLQQLMNRGRENTQGPPNVITAAEAAKRKQDQMIKERTDSMVALQRKREEPQRAATDREQDAVEGSQNVAGQPREPEAVTEPKKAASDQAVMEAPPTTAVSSQELSYATPSVRMQELLKSIDQEIDENADDVISGEPSPSFTGAEQARSQIERSDPLSSAGHSTFQNLEYVELNRAPGQPIMVTDDAPSTTSGPIDHVPAPTVELGQPNLDRSMDMEKPRFDAAPVGETAKPTYTAVDQIAEEEKATLRSFVGDSTLEVVTQTEAIGLPAESDLLSTPDTAIQRTPGEPSRAADDLESAPAEADSPIASAPKSSVGADKVGASAPSEQNKAAAAELFTSDDVTERFGAKSVLASVEPSAALAPNELVELKRAYDAPRGTVQAGQAQAPWSSDSPIAAQEPAQLGQAPFVSPSEANLAAPREFPSSDAQVTTPEVLQDESAQFIAPFHVDHPLQRSPEAPRGGQPSAPEGETTLDGKNETNPLQVSRAQINEHGDRPVSAGKDSVSAAVEKGSPEITATSPDQPLLRVPGIPQAAAFEDQSSPVDQGSPLVRGTVSKSGESKTEEISVPQKTESSAVAPVTAVEERGDVPQSKFDAYGTDSNENVPLDRGDLSLRRTRQLEGEIDPTVFPSPASASTSNPSGVNTPSISTKQDTASGSVQNESPTADPQGKSRGRRGAFQDEVTLERDIASPRMDDLSTTEVPNTTGTSPDVPLARNVAPQHAVEENTVTEQVGTSQASDSITSPKLPSSEVATAQGTFVSKEQPGSQVRTEQETSKFARSPNAARVARQGSAPFDSVDELDDPKKDGGATENGHSATATAADVTLERDISNPRSYIQDAEKTQTEQQVQVSSTVSSKSPASKTAVSANEPKLHGGNSQETSKFTRSPNSPRQGSADSMGSDGQPRIDVLPPGGEATNQALAADVTLERDISSPRSYAHDEETAAPDGVVNRTTKAAGKTSVRNAPLAPDPASFKINRPPIVTPPPKAEPSKPKETTVEQETRLAKETLRKITIDHPEITERAFTIAMARAEARFEREAQQRPAPIADPANPRTSPFAFGDSARDEAKEGWKITQAVTDVERRLYAEMDRRMAQQQNLHETEITRMDETLDRWMNNK
jgi:hypothetical protein